MIGWGDQQSFLRQWYNSKKYKTQAQLDDFLRRVKHKTLNFVLLKNAKCENKKVNYQT